MPIIHRVGRKHVRTRLLVGVICLLLCTGAVTMLYPFGLMLGGSTKSAVAQKELRVIPGFLRDDTLLYRKYVESLFNEELPMTQAAYDEGLIAFERAEPLERIQDELVHQYAEFLGSLGDDPFLYSVGFLRARTTRGMQMQVLRELIHSLREEFDQDLAEANKKMETHFVNWHVVAVDPQIALQRFQNIGNDALSSRYRELKKKQPLLFRWYFSIEGMYKNIYLKPKYTRDIAAYNDAHGTDHVSYDAVRLTQRVPEGTSLEVEDWERFVRQAFHIQWIRADEGAVVAYRNFLQAKYLTLDAFNGIYSTAFGTFDEIPSCGAVRLGGIAEADGLSFIRGWKDPATQQIHALPREMISIESLDFRFRGFLLTRHGNIEGINGKLGTSYASVSEIATPQKQLHYCEFLKKWRFLRWEFATRNYVTVIHYLLINGRALFNTVVYCSLAILAALIVNPMAAYALSRFALPSTYKVLLFLMVTMAFPPMVTQIPVFLTLRNLHLLNTFWALILPGLANGYLILSSRDSSIRNPRNFTNVRLSTAPTSGCSSGSLP